MNEQEGDIEWQPPPTDGPNTRERWRDGFALGSGATKGNSAVQSRDAYDPGSSNWSINEWREWHDEANAPQVRSSYLRALWKNLLRVTGH